MDDHVTDDDEGNPIVYVCRKKIIRIEEYFDSKRIRSLIARRYRPDHRLYHTHAMMRYELYPPEMEADIRNELYAYAYNADPEEELGSGGEEEVPDVEEVLARVPTFPRAMERPASWMRIDGSARGLLWQIPDLIRIRKSNEGACFACSCY